MNLPYKIKIPVFNPEGVRWDLLRNTLYQAGARKGALMLPQTRPVLVDMGILGAELRDLSAAYPKRGRLP